MDKSWDEAQGPSGFRPADMCTPIYASGDTESRPVQSLSSGAHRPVWEADGD